MELPLTLTSNLGPGNLPHHPEHTIIMDCHSALCKYVLFVSSAVLKAP